MLGGKQRKKEHCDAINPNKGDPEKLKEALGSVKPEVQQIRANASTLLSYLT